MTRATYPPVPDTAAFHLLQTLTDGVEDVNQMSTLYVFRAGGWSTAGMEAMANVIADSWQTRLAAQLADDLTLNRVTYKDLANPLNLTFEHVEVKSGSRVAEILPMTMCAVVQFVGEEATLPRRAYIRQGGICEDQSRGNNLVVASADAIAAGWNLVRSDMEASDALTALVIVSVLEPKANTPPAGEPYRDEGIINPVGTISVRRLIGRSVSRLR